MNLNQMSADIAKLKREVAALMNTSIVGFSKTTGKGGVSFSKPTNTTEPTYAQPKTVVIVREPVAGDKDLLVREAKYQNWPPKPCEGEGESKTCFYEWHGDPFAIYPPMGKEAVDYAGDELVDAPEPKLDTVFHRCHREHNSWVLDLKPEGGSETVFVRIIQSIPDNAPTSTFLMVQRMKPAEEGEPSGRLWVEDGEQEEAECWPEYTAANYLPMKGVTPFVICAMMIRNGTQYVMQNNRMFLGQPLPGLETSDCEVPLRIP